jgi:hypothetical protein
MKIVALSRSMKVALVITVTVVSGCGGGGYKSSTKTTTAPSGANNVATTASSGSATHGALAVTGFLSVSLKQSPSVTSPCKVPTTGTTTSGGLEGNTSGILGFNDGNGGYYALQFSLAPGTSTFPAAATKNIVAFYPSSDSSKEWSIGTQVSKTQSGTATLSGKHGTVDVDMAPEPPKPNPSLTPIHVKGTFDCP